MVGSPKTFDPDNDLTKKELKDDDYRDRGKNRLELYSRLS